MRDALLQVRLKSVKYLDEDNTECVNWSGLIECGAAPNGIYVGMVPFENMILIPGAITPINPPILVYDGTGGYCNEATEPNANLHIQVAVTGIDGNNNEPLYGSGPLPPAPHPHSNIKDVDGDHVPSHPKVMVEIPPPPHGPGRKRRACLWFYFIVENLC